MKNGILFTLALATLLLTGSFAYSGEVVRDELAQVGYSGPTDFWDATERSGQVVYEENKEAPVEESFAAWDFYSDGVPLDTRPPGAVIIVR